MKAIALQNRKKAFTVVELIIVIAFVAALTTGAVAIYRRLNSSIDEMLKRNEVAFVVRTLNQYNQLLKLTGTKIAGVCDAAAIAAVEALWGGSGPYTVTLDTAHMLVSGLDLSISDLSISAIEFSERAWYDVGSGKWKLNEA